jgi:hypothetical protein
MNASLIGTFINKSAFIRAIRGKQSRPRIARMNADLVEPRLFFIFPQL